MDEVINKSSELLKTVYKDDFVAVSQILSAEIHGNKEILISYLDCLEEYILKLKERLSE